MAIQRKDSSKDNKSPQGGGGSRSKKRFRERDVDVRIREKGNSYKEHKKGIRRTEKSTEKSYIPPRVNLHIKDDGEEVAKSDKKWLKEGCMHCCLYPCSKTFDKFDQENYKGKIKNGGEELGNATYRCSARGSKSPKILFVGESVNRYDDSNGYAFSGQVGDLLISALNDAGINTDDCRFTTVMRCAMPPDTKASFTDCIPCSAYLAAEIQKVKPDIIVPLGALAVKVLTNNNKAKLGDYLGVFNNISLAVGDFDVFALWSAGFVFFDMGYYEDFVYYLTKLRDRLIGEMDVLDAYNIVISMDAESLAETKVLLPVIEEADYLTFDVETASLSDEDSALNPYSENTKIVCIAFDYGQDRAITLFTYHPDIDVEVLEENKRIAIELLQNSTPKIAHNAKFDMKYIRLKWGVDTVNFVEDTMLTHYATITERPGTHKLKSLAARYADMGDYAKLIREEKVFEDGQSTFEFSIYELGKYNALDVIATRRISDRFKERIIKKKTPAKRVAEQLLPVATEALCDLEINGLHVNVRMAKKVRDAFSRNMQVVQDTIQADPKVRMFIRNLDLLRKKGIIGKSVKEFKYGSSAQLAVILHHRKFYNFPIYGYTDKGQISTKSSVLNKLMLMQDGVPLVHDMLEYRRIKKTLSTYLIPFRKKAKKEKGYIHGNFNLFVTVTGRIASARPNLQNIPNKSAGHVKRLFTSRYKNGLLIGMDYSQVELRVLAILSGDETMLNIYKEGKDLHKQTMLALYGVDEAEVDTWDESTLRLRRTVAKKINFGIAYGITADGIVNILENEGIVVSQEEAEFYISMFFLRYPGVKAFIDSTNNKMMRTGNSLSAFGRVRRFPELSYSRALTKKFNFPTGNDDNTVRRAKRQAVNHVIQSTASDVTLCSLVILNQWLKSNYDNACIFNCIHDAIDIDADVNVAAEIINKATDIMSHLDKYINFIFPETEFFDKFYNVIPFTVSVEAGVNWRDMIELDEKVVVDTKYLRKIVRESREQQRDKDRKLFTEVII